MLRRIRTIRERETLAWQDYASLGIVFGLILSLPLVVLLPLGIALDKKMGTLPAFLLGGFFVALAFSSIMLYRVITDVTRGDDA